ncbi:unnamed protein product [Pedinophyceae sp. YPF-701]|nr:unnamed protein product [Pedinophyceae sp. YPF-701]
MGYAPDVLAGIRELEVAARRDKALLQGGDGSSLQGLGGKDGGKDMALVVGQGTRLLINLNKGKKMVDPSKALVGPDAGDVKPAGVASGVADFDPEAAAFSYGGKGRLIMSKRAVQKRVVGFDEAAERSYGAAVLKQTEQEQRDAEREALEAKKLSEHRVKLERRAHDLQAKSDAARRAYHQELRAAVAETEQKKYAAVAARIGQVRSSQQKMAPAVAPGDENLTAGAAGAGLPGQRDEGKEATEKRLKEKLYRIELAKQIQANREEKARANLDRVRGERAALAEMEAMQVGSVLDARRAKVEQQQAVDAMLTVAGLGKGRTHEGL